MEHHRSPRRILMVSEYFYPHWTGLAQSFLSLAQSLASDGHEVTVLTTRYSPTLACEEPLGPLRIVRARCLFYISRTNYSAALLLKSAMHMKRSDLIIINSPCSNILFLSILAALRRIPLHIFHQGDLHLARHRGHRIKNFFIERVFDLFTIPSCWLASRLFTYTDDYASHSRVMKFFPAKTRAVIPPIRIADEAKALPATETLGSRQSEDGPRIGFAGRFVEEKGFDVLLEAIPEVLKRYPKARFIFAGETNVYYERFYELLTPRITELGDTLSFLGLLTGTALARFYRDLDLFVLCSRSDCFALTQAEAALAGVPLVVSDIPGARVLVRETGCGVLVKPNDPGALATGIFEVLSARERYTAKLTNVGPWLARYERYPAD